MYNELIKLRDAVGRSYWQDVKVTPARAWARIWLANRLHRLDLKLIQFSLDSTGDWI